MKPVSWTVPLLIENSEIWGCIKAQSRFFYNFNVQASWSYNSSLLSEKFASLLDHCPNVDSLKKIHACIFTQGLQDNTLLGSKLINSCAKLGLLTESKWVFSKIITNNLYLWHSIIVGYFRGGHFDEVLGLYLELRRRDIGTSCSAITFAVKSCLELASLNFGRSIHADTFKVGLNVNQFVGSSLIRLYGKLDDIDQADKVFGEIIDKDVVVYTSLVTAYAQIGDSRTWEAFRVARSMWTAEIEPNRVTLISLLQAASFLESLQVGNSIHGYAIRRGIGWSDEVFETSITDMYLKCRVPDKAALCFCRMSKKTIGSWNALITGHLQLGQPLKALELFLEMLQDSFVPDLITLANVLLSCGYLGHLVGGKSIHAYFLRNGVELDLVATTALIDMYFKCNGLIQAKEVFNRIDTKDNVSFNVMISGYLKNGFSCQAVEEFSEMLRSGLRPNVSTILNVLAAVSNLVDVRHCKCIHGFVITHGFETNTEVANQLIYIYSKCSAMNDVRQVFGRIANKDLVSWTSMIMAHVNSGLADDALILFRLMQKEKLNPDSVALVCLLQALAQIGCLSLAREVHNRVYRLSLDDDISIFNCLITTYSKCGKLNTARNLFELVAERDLATWNSMISAYGMHGDWVQALKLFELMKKDKVVPDELTMMSLLSACSHAGKVEDGLCVFNSMREEYLVVPSGEHFSCVVDLLSRAGHLEEAYSLLNCLPSTQNASALGALLAACRIHGNTHMVEIIGRRLLELEPQNPSAYNLVSNLFAEQEKWEEVANVRGIAEGRGLKNIAGSSIIEFR